ncbi:acyl-CoA dehydrogenase [Desulfotomaculum arcticum]|uniref:Acyl-CoA dehydrogenase n=1 Tax=Desulfotruncus arcticus DSM 17038 TaxID=1121424 RepID=A0A1I2TFS5_9FIRM|nr:acyl-CoA dehydrogenase family protein [Desulfotruncus arcticus]SFG63784.1 acyl-CoA dehydrogenase [Desulfotomaculum arcticum] [Desulfotruncus arcticus DSM 17038]
MISFEISQEQKQIMELACKFTKNEIIPVAAEYDTKAEMPWPIIKKAFEIGLWNLNIPEEYGGPGLDQVSEILIYEELAYGCLGIFGSFAGNSLALTPLLIAGTDQQKKKFLEPFSEKPKLAAFALTEPNAGSDASNVSTTAKKDSNGYILNGTKCFITHGGIANLYTVFASTDRSKGIKGLSAFLVPGDTPGLTMGKKEDKMGDRASHIGEVILENVRVPLDNLLGREGEGFKIAMKTLDITRPTIAAGAVGVARRALDEAKNYAKERIQFGKPIADQQAIQFMLADMAMEIMSSRALVWQAAAKIEKGEPDTMLSAAAKCKASDTAMKVTIDALQVFGGYGYMKEYPMEKLMRDAKITQIYEGTNQIQRIVIASQLLK